jgi:hypothetical protein
MTDIDGVSHLVPKIASNWDLDDGTVHFGKHPLAKINVASAVSHPQALDAALVLFGLWKTYVAGFGVAAVAHDAKDRENVLLDARRCICHKEILAITAMFSDAVCFRHAQSV